jgi:hypothetical protein
MIVKILKKGKGEGYPDGHHLYIYITVLKNMINK